MAFWNLLKNSKAQDDVIRQLLAGSDLGYGQVKILSGDLKAKFLSAAGTPVSDFGRVAAITGEDELLQSLAITMDSQKHYIGHNAVVNTRNGRLSLRQNKAESIENKIKFVTSLALLTAEDDQYTEFDIVTGLPVLEFKNQQDSLYNMMFNFGRPFEFTMHYGPKQVKKSLKIKNIKIISQGEGAFYDYILDMEGNIIEDKSNNVSGKVMMVDPGYRTSDIVTMENGVYMETLSDQFNKGVNQIHQEVLRLIMERLNIKKELKDMDEIVRTGILFHNMQEYNVAKIIDDAVKPFAEDLIDNLHTVSNDTLGSLQRIILTGGGSEIIHTHVKQLLAGIVEVELITDAEYSNVRGYYKYGLLLKNAGAF
jgi:plasmid segregation protein ParM